MENQFKDANYQLDCLARDIIDMIREYKNDKNAMEYVSSFCFYLSMAQPESLVDWHNIFLVADTLYSSDTEVKFSDIDKEYLRICNRIAEHSKTKDI